MRKYIRSFFENTTAFLRGTLASAARNGADTHEEIQRTARTSPRVPLYNATETRRSEMHTLLHMNRTKLCIEFFLPTAATYAVRHSSRFFFETKRRHILRMIASAAMIALWRASAPRKTVFASATPKPTTASSILPIPLSDLRQSKVCPVIFKIAETSCPEPSARSAVVLTSGRSAGENTENNTASDAAIGRTLRRKLSKIR